MTPEALKAVYQDSNSWQQVADAVNHDTPTTTGEWTPTQTGRHFRQIPEWNIDGVTIIADEDEIKQLSKSILAALDAERENVEIAHRGMDHYHDEAEKLRDQLASAVEALKRIVEIGQDESGGLMTPSESVADAALAKIGGKP